MELSGVAIDGEPRSSELRGRIESRSGCNDRSAGGLIVSPGRNRRVLRGGRSAYTRGGSAFSAGAGPAGRRGIARSTAARTARRRVLGIAAAIAAAIVIFPVSDARAGPPFVTDDPDPVGYKAWEVNYAITGSWRHGGMSSGLPSIDINYGAVPDVQLHLQPRLAVETAGSTTRIGLDDTEVGIKYRLLNAKQGDTATMVGFYPIYLLPTGAHALGPDRGNHQLFLPLWLQHEAGRWTLYGGPGYRINPGAESRNSTFAGATALYGFSEALQLGGEVFGETPSARAGHSTSGFNLGGRCRITGTANLLFSAGRGLRNPSDTNQFTFYLAVQALY